MYKHLEIEKKWQNKWEESNAFATTDKSDNKYYVLDMFPYPSGAGLHVGHPEGYTATDIVARHKRLLGFWCSSSYRVRCFWFTSRTICNKNR